MKKNKIGIVLTISVILVVALAIYLGNALANKTATVNKNTKNEMNAVTKVIEDNISKTSKNLIDNSIKNDIVDEMYTNTVNLNSDFDTNKVNKNTSKTENENPNQKAIDLVKKEWGNDSGIYFNIDEVNDNKYVVSVRDTSTTVTLAWYEVDLDNNTVNEKN